MAKLRTVTMSFEVLEDLLVVGNKIRADVTDGLPDGARLVNAHYDGLRKQLVLTFEHESFDDIQGVPPEQHVVLVRSKS